MKRIIVLAGCLLVSLLAPSVFASQVFVPTDFGLSARGVAMGNAMTAVDGDMDLMYFNPGAMAKFPSGAVQLGYLATDPNLLGGPKGDMKEFDQRNNILIVNLIEHHPGFIKGEHPFAIGLSLYFDRSGKGFINFVDLEDSDGRFYRYGLVSTAAVMSVAVGVTKWLYLGAGSLVTLRGTTDFYVKTDLGGKTKSEGMVLDARLYYSAVASFFLDFDKVDLGVAYHGENYGQMGDITVDAEATVGDSTLTKLPMLMSFKDTFIPQNSSVGAAFHLTKDFTIALDGTWYNWGRFDRIVQSGDLSRAGVDLDMVDTYVPRIGFEYHLMEDLPLRWGYSWQQTPLRSFGSNNNVFLDNDRHVGSLGLGYTIKSTPVIATPITFDAAYFHQYLVPDTYKTSEGKKYQSEGNVNGGVFSLMFRF